jgi:hypothetical protein
MYIAKFIHNEGRWNVTLMEKRWSDSLLSHEIELIGNRKFFLYSSGQRWIRKQIIKNLVKYKQLEILDG